ncbi:MAG: hypothetical protein KAU95_04525 [Candidatus Aenigmarchaeota archaeon]|nr:hypothetical protein [Candidatus Aenigmarchaeota archaeon]
MVTRQSGTGIFKMGELSSRALLTGIMSLIIIVLGVIAFQQVVQTNCGNEICEIEEDCNTCPKDCGCDSGEFCNEIGICAGVICGDEICSEGETKSCCEDCGCPKDKICNKFTQTCQEKPSFSDEEATKITENYMLRKNINGTIKISDAYYRDEIAKQVSISCETYGIVLFINNKGEIVKEFRTS